MKLAESLTQIKDLKGKIAKLQMQLHSKLVAKKLDKDQKIPDNDGLISQILELSEQLASLKSKVAATNVKHGLHAKIHQLQEAKFLVTMLEPLTTTEQMELELDRGYGASASEKYEVHATFSVQNAKNLHAAEQKRLRELDLELQKQNWVIDLVDH